jgi:superfamily II DNA or RNA helicase
MVPKSSYFERYSGRLSLSADGEGGLRACQLGAYWAVWAHYTSSDDPALVSLPTGAGKTALMMLLAFGLKARRVLVITPGQVLRDQLRSQFLSMDVLRGTGAIPKGLPKPTVLSNGAQLKSAAAWEALRDYDVIVATPYTTSPAQAGVSQPPEGLFDLVFIDEAHHVAAPTWSAVLRAFGKAKCVLLTATAFRRDKRRIPVVLSP